MPLIITATDFSHVADNAVHYACGLALATGAHLVVLHSFILPVMFSDVPVITGTLAGDEQKDADAQMGQLIAELKTRYPALSAAGKVVYGDTIDILADYQEPGNAPWMIVIGNSSRREETSWTESILVNALKSLQYPVLAVPPGTEYKQVSNICFAVDRIDEQAAIAMQLLGAIAQKLGAGLQVMHAAPQNAPADKTITDAQLKTLTTGLNVEYHVLQETQDVNGAILKFVEQRHADWLMIMPRKHSFFDALLHKSHTSSLVQMALVPVLAIHEHK